MWLTVWSIGCSSEDEGKLGGVNVPVETGVSPVETGTTPVDTSDTTFPDDTGDDVRLTWTAVDIGGSYACGLVSDGTVRCWGMGECANAEPPRSETFTQVSVGILAACGLKTGGAVACWACELATEPQHDIAREVPPGVFESINVGHEAACARDAAGLLTCWGNDVWQAPRTPTEPVLDYQIDSANACAVLEDGTLDCWGYSTQWGDDLPPVDVAFTQVAVGRRHTCGLDAAGQAYCWGDDTMLAPFPAPPPGVWAQIEAFDSVTCVIDAAGAAQCWWGEGLSFPYWPDAFPEPMTMIGLGEYEGCGVTLAGVASCWGVPTYLPSMQIPQLNP